MRTLINWIILFAALALLAVGVAVEWAICKLSGKPMEDTHS